MEEPGLKFTGKLTLTLSTVLSLLLQIISYSVVEAAGSQIISAAGMHTCGLKANGTVVCWGNHTYGESTPPAATFTQVTSGFTYTCGVKTDGTVACWGSNDYGQSLPPDGTFTQVSARDTYTCGVKTDGTVVCWGNNLGGQSPPAGTFTSVSPGAMHTCGLKADGTVACWGIDGGDGRATPPAGIFTQVSSGSMHTCGLKADGTIACWGNNDNGRATAVDATFTDVSSGYDQTCAVRTDGTVACWGNNDHGQATPPTGTFIQVSAGTWNTCGLKTNGTAACWGDDANGQSTPPAGTFGTGKLDAGVHHTCGLKTDGTVACWGSDAYGASTPAAGTFTVVSAGDSYTCGVKTGGTVACWGINDHGQATAPAGTFTQVSASTYHTCGLNTDGTAACWGMNSLGQSTAPVGTFKGVSAGGFHTCGLKEDGTANCWGYNSDGQTTPAAGTFTGVSAGGNHTCGLKTDGTVACWGSDAYGESTPAAGTFTGVSAGWYHACAVKTNGTVACWGRNDYGQSTPPAGTFTEVSAGDYYTCGMRTNGTVACWGRNDGGQAPVVTIGPDTLPKGVLGYSYSQAIGGGGGSSPYAFSMISGSLPAGLILSVNGMLSGTPGSAGDFTFTVRAADKNNIAAEKTYTLRVEVMSYSVTPSSLSFHSLINVQSAAQSLTMHNTGTLPVTISGIALGGTNPLQFAQTGNCGGSLAVGASCTINVTFKPTWVNASPMIATLNVNTAAPAVSKTIALSGTTDVMSYNLTPASLFFHSPVNFQSAAQTVTMSNTGTVPVTISGITVGGTNPGQFGQNNNCGSSLAVGTSCEVNVIFKPTWFNAVPMLATLTVNAAAPAGSRTTALSGTVDIISYSLTPAALTFRSPLNVQSAAQTMTIHNTGTLPVTISGIALGGTNPLQFGQNNNCPAALSAGASCVVSVTFKPTWLNAAPMIATLNINAASPAISKTIALAGALDYAATPASLSFHSTMNVQSAAQKVTVSNTTAAPVTISGIAIGGTNPLQFGQSNNCPATLSAGASCVVSVAFKPTWLNAAPMKATLDINVAAPAISKSIGLTGTIQ